MIDATSVVIVAVACAASAELTGNGLGKDGAWRSVLCYS